MTKFREAPVDLIEAILDLEIPNSYRGFLLERQSAVIDGFKIMGVWSFGEYCYQCQDAAASYEYP